MKWLEQQWKRMIPNVKHLAASTFWESNSKVAAFVNYYYPACYYSYLRFEVFFQTVLMLRTNMIPKIKRLDGEMCAYFFGNHTFFTGQMIKPVKNGFKIFQGQEYVLRDQTACITMTMETTTQQASATYTVFSPRNVGITQHPEKHPGNPV